MSNNPPTDVSAGLNCRISQVVKNSNQAQGSLFGGKRTNKIIIKENNLECYSTHFHIH
jgi:hypothetical protein